MEMANELEANKVCMPVSTYKLGYIFHMIRWQEPQTLVGKGA